MHLHFERTLNAKSDCSILSLTWMGKVPDELPEDEGWKLNRTNYYQEGWLATGNIRGIVGVTFTTSHCKKNVEFPLRTNYNLRGHRSEVILVKWNEPYQKLASCDSSGIIFVWIKYEGRWSIELINDRNTPVTHFSWSHDGRMALICYQDGFVLVGSVAGQRYWSSMLNLEATITCGIWTPDDQQVYFGTTSGQIIVMDVHGAMVSQVQLSSDVGIVSMAWSCEKFKMEEGDENDPGVTNAAERKFVLAVSLQNGFIYLLKTFDDVSPIQMDTKLQGPVCMEWSNSRELLAVAGVTLGSKSSPNQNQNANQGQGQTQPNQEYANMLKFYNEKGILLYCISIPYTQAPVTALTWGHNDKRLFLATGTQIHIAWVSRRIATLQLLCRLRIHDSILGEGQIVALPLPPRIRNLIGNLFAQTIRCCVPEPSALREFVSRPPVGSVRLHCTMIRHDEDSNISSGTCYTLYLEYLGGLVPLLKGKRTSKIRPEFVIFDPQVEDFSAISLNHWSSESKSSGSSSQSTSGGNLASDSSDSDRDEGCTSSPRLQRRRKRRNKSRSRNNYGDRSGQSSGDADPEDLAYVDTLPEHVRLVEVTSNIWGTKFKIHGLVNSVPANLGQVTYKTSLLHLQPRQMTLVMTELRDDFPVGPDPTFNPNLFSEDEEEICQAEEKARLRRVSIDNCPPIAPMSPRGSRFTKPTKGTYSGDNTLSSTTRPGSGPSAVVPALAKAESYDDEITEARCLCTNGSNSSSSTESVREGIITSQPLHHHHQLQPLITTHQPPKHPTSSAQISTTSFVGQLRNCNLTMALGTSGSCTHSGQVQNQRHIAISPLCCDGAVPALQSPKNAVAPSDIIFERPYNNVDYNPSRNDYQCPTRNLTLNLNSEKIKNHSGRPPTGSGLQVGRVHTRIRTAQVQTPSVPQSTQIQGPSQGLKEILFIDEESSTPGPSTTTTTIASSIPISNTTVDTLIRTGPGSVSNSNTALGSGPAPIADAMVRSCSVGYLDLVDAQIVPNDVALLMLRKDAPKRLVLVNRKHRHHKKQTKKSQQTELRECRMNKTPNLKNCGKSKSLDSSDIFPPNNDIKVQHKTKEIIPEVIVDTKKSTAVSEESVQITNLGNLSTVNNNNLINTNNNNNNNKKEPSKLSIFVKSPLSRRKKDTSDTEKNNKSRSRSKQKKNDKGVDSPTHKSGMSLHTHALATLENLLTRLREDDGRSTPPNSPRLPRSQPASPAPSKKGKRPQSASPIRKNLLSSPLLGRRNRKNKNLESSDDEVTASGDEVCNGTNYKDLETFQKAQLRQKLKRGKIEPNGSNCNNHVVPQRREFVMHNKAPMWNENSQVYQLDFGGRVTQESAKNFQIEFRGKQVMQFGRIDGNAYTLDFQYPFSALQAFAVALANVTQRLK
ncbi:LOW QUALITY PROTEIN: tubby-related protein 4-like [Atheta coriaria]|uniref:LOW QUALITY PROTEIN: tubby-related protein 4-like n=1 Tax=Dalotia coriaria TaxID=877792 RepID=UPI0031F43CD1